MSSFDYAIKEILVAEGGDKYTDNPADNGGATKYGISLRFYKDRISESATKDTIKNLTEQDARNIYLKYFWIPAQLSLISNQALANKIFHFVVNMGVSQGVKIAQRALYSIYGYGCVEDDGVMGPITLLKINNNMQLDKLSYLAALRSEAAGFYRSIAKGDDKSFLKGWLRRAYS